MTGRLIRIALALYLTGVLAVGTPAFGQTQAPAPQQSPSQQNQSQPQAAAAPNLPPNSYVNLLSQRNYTRGKRTFPNFFRAYSPQSVPSPDLTNTPSIYSLIKDGKLELSLQDAIALALQNDLDIAVQEYIPWINQANLLSAEGGGTPFAGTTSTAGGTFDPVISATTSISDATTPANNSLQGGSATAGPGTFLIVKSHTETFNVGYSQKFHEGTLFSVSLNNTRGSSSLFQDFFNPFVQSNLAVSLQQPLLNGFGRLANMRFILEARNNTQVGRLQFEEQVIASVTQVENQYWALVADEQAVDVAKQTLAVSQRLYEDDQRQLQIGTLAHLDVVTAQSAIATNNQALIAAQTNALQQGIVVLNLITKDPMEKRLQGIEVVPTTPLEENPQIPNIQLPDAVSEAWANRPELKVDALTLKNDQIEVHATRNSLLPSLTLSGQYTSAGLGGTHSSTIFTPAGTFEPCTAPGACTVDNTIVDSTGTPTGGFIGVPLGGFSKVVTPGGIGTTYSDIFRNNFPTYSASLNLSLPLRNRSAQAANAVAQLTQREEQTIQQRDKNTIVVGVRQALTAVQQDAAQVQATVQATQLAQETYDDEVKKFDLGASTTYNVVLQSRDLNAAKLNELTAKTNLEIALVNLNQALGRTLTNNNITIASRLGRQLDPNGNAPLIPGTIDGRLAGVDVFGLGIGK
ncbi:MAG TPA: TolC family protein [Candidatus Acidoferrales bacterium]|nr:TolC family protein [Candidatus Acidoferrales bacterium]